MIKIAICDDDNESVSAHEKTVRSTLHSCGVGYDITTYTQSANLLFDITDDDFYYDLILLDIEMPGLTGMEIAEKIKPYLPNVRIIFITSHLEYAIDAYELSIFRYVPKNDNTDRLSAAVSDAAKLIELESGEEYIIQSSGHFEKIPYKDILYIRRDSGKNSIFCTNSGEVRIRKSLHQIFDEFDTPEFIFIERGYIVNIIKIMKISDGTVVLKNGEKLPVSRAHLQKVKQQISRFWGEHI